MVLSWVFPTPTPEYKKSFENDAQSSDNINFLKVQWSSRQLPTVRLQAGATLNAPWEVWPGGGGDCRAGRVCVCVSGIRVFALFKWCRTKLKFVY